MHLSMFPLPCDCRHSRVHFRSCLVTVVILLVQFAPHPQVQAEHWRHRVRAKLARSTGRADSTPAGAAAACRPSEGENPATLRASYKQHGVYTCVYQVIELGAKPAPAAEAAPAAAAEPAKPPVTDAAVAQVAAQVAEVLTLPPSRARMISVHCIRARVSSFVYRSRWRCVHHSNSSRVQLLPVG